VPACRRDLRVPGMRLDREHPARVDLVLAAGDILIDELAALLVEHGLGDIGDPDAVGESHIISVGAPRQQQHRQQ